MSGNMAWIANLIVMLFGVIIGAVLGIALSDHPKAKIARTIAWIFFAINLFFLGLASQFWALIISIPLGYFAFTFVREYFRDPDKRRHGGAFGSAQFATTQSLKNAGHVGRQGIRLGAFDEAKKIALHYTGDQHLMTVAPTRTGKGVSAIVPNLLTYRGSMVVVDPKGENAMITEKQRQALGQDVHVVDPWEITVNKTGRQVSGFNPMDWLEPDDPDIAENAMMLADALVLPTEGGNSFFDEEAKSLIAGLILFVATDDETSLRNLGRVYDLMMGDGDALNELFTKMYKRETHALVSSTGARQLQKDPKTLANVMASAQTQISFLGSERIRKSLSQSSFDFADLKRKQMTVYLVLPADRIETFNRWFRLLVQQSLTVCARNIEDRPDMPVLFMIDEMPAMGRLAMLEQAYGLMAGFNMQMWGIVQNLSQLERVYGKGWETFIGNSGVIQYFGSRDKMTADYFSHLCGMTTVKTITSSVGRVFQSLFSPSFDSSSSGTSTSEAARPLIYPDELMVLAKDKQLLFIENSDPILGNKTPWFMDGELQDKGRNLHFPSDAQRALDRALATTHQSPDPDSSPNR